MRTFLIITIIMSACLVSINGFCENHCFQGQNNVNYQTNPSLGFCYCDSVCQFFRDCCNDFCQQCTAIIDNTSGWCSPIVNAPPKNICQSSSRAVPSSWCQTYCAFDASGSCTAVQPHMVSVCECNTFDRENNITQICKSLSPSVSDDWCSSYCHITVVNNQNTCSVDAHMSSICSCAFP